MLHFKIFENICYFVYWAKIIIGACLSFIVSGNRNSVSSNSFRNLVTGLRNQLNIYCISHPVLKIVRYL